MFIVTESQKGVPGVQYAYWCDSGQSLIAHAKSLVDRMNPAPAAAVGAIGTITSAVNMIEILRGVNLGVIDKDLFDQYDAWDDVVLDLAKEHGWYRPNAAKMFYGEFQDFSRNEIIQALKMMQISCEQHEDEKNYSWFFDDGSSLKTFGEGFVITSAVNEFDGNESVETIEREKDALPTLSPAFQFDR